MKIIKVNKIRNNEIKVKNKYKFPTYNISGTNNFYFSLIGGVRGAGKSSVMINILENENVLLEGDNKVYFISPTKDDKVQMMIDKYPDKFVYIDELTIDNINKVLSSIKTRLDEWEFQKNLLLEDINLNEIDENIINNIDINLDHPPISTLVLDDSMASPLISSSQSKAGKEFLKFALKHRHHPYYCHLFILSQHLKSISKPLRVQCNLVIIFPFRDFTVYKGIFDEYSGLFDNKIDNFLSVMKKIEQRNNNSFLLIFYDSKKFIRINFDEEVLI